MIFQTRSSIKRKGVRKRIVCVLGRDMGRQASGNIKNIDLAAAETQLILHCAPLLAGLKVSNLLILPKGQVQEVQKPLKDTRVSCFFLHRGEGKTTLFLYRARALYRFLADPPVRDMLLRCGYRMGQGCGRSEALLQMLGTFAARYRAYLEKERDFPHEMGLFLGYPVEDVQGFIDNHGKNALYTGYWKVYQNSKEKIGLFRSFDLVKAAMLFMAARGVSIPEAAKCSIALLNEADIRGFCGLV